MDISELMVHMSGTPDIAFEDWDDVVRYLEGVYRTDSKWKHIDKHTADNFVIRKSLDDGELDITPFGGSVIRNHLMELSKKHLEELTDLSGQDIVHNVTYIEITHPNNELDIIMSLDLKDVEMTVKSVARISEDFDDYILWVFHQDRSRYHLHGVKFK